MTDRWPWLALADVLVAQPNRKALQQGWSPKCHAHPAEDGRWGVLKTTAIQAGWFDPAHNKALPDGLSPRRAIEVRKGDLLMTCAGPRSRCGIPTLVRHTPERLMMSGKMYRFRPDERVNPAFLEKWLLSPEAQRRIDAMKTGISDSGLNLTHDRFVRLPVPVPPLEEQHRIVAVLDDHLSRLDDADGSLQTALRRLAVLRSRTLADLHSGSPVALGDLAVEAGYGTSAKCVPGGPGPAVVRIPNLVDGLIDLADEKRVANVESDVSKYLLAPGDLLIVRTNGSVDLIGRSAVVQPGIDAAFASYLIRYRVRNDVVRPMWVHAMLSTPQLRAQIESLAASSAGQHNLSLGKLHPLRLPVPPLTEQDAALGRLAALDGEVARLRAVLDVARVRSSGLRRAVLGAAFTGKLTRADSGSSLTEGLMNV